MSRSLTAGAELYLCLRCEARSLIDRSLRPIHPRFQRYGTTIARAFSTDPSNGLNTTQAFQGEQRNGQQLTHNYLKTLTVDDSLRLSATNDGQESNLYGASRAKRDVSRKPVRESLSYRNRHLEPQNSSREFHHDTLKYPSYRQLDVASDRVELGLERLGEPATIRVLPERPHRSRPRNVHPKLSKKDKGAEKTTQLDQSIRTSVDSMAQAIDSKSNKRASIPEVMNNIETLREAFSKSINHLEGPSHEDCYKLASSLQRGFTMNQLATYWKLTLPMNRPKADSLDILSATERYSVSRWYAGTCGWPVEALRRLNRKEPTREKAHYAILHTKLMDDDGVPIQDSKQTIINNILSLCWGLRPVEEKLQEGSVSLQIERHWLALLLQQDEPVFQQVSKLFNVKTEISEGYKLVKVSGTYDACVDAVRMITNSVDALQVEQIALLDENSSKQLTEMQSALLKDITNNHHFWQQTEDQTSTKIVPIRPVPTGTYTKVNVFYLPTDIKGLVGARRRISQLREILQQKSLPCVCIPWTSENIASLVPLPKSTDMALMDQNFNWYRWRSWLPAALNFDQEKDAISTTNFSDSTLLSAGDTQSVQMTKRLFAFWEQLHVRASKILAGERFNPDYWDPQPRTSIVASLGHLVHAIPDSIVSRVQKNIDGMFKMGVNHAPTVTAKIAEKIFQHRRIMTAGIPSLTDALDKLIPDDSTVSNFFKIILSPSIINGDLSISAGKLPTLEIEVVINETSKTTSLHRVCLVLNRGHVDLVLPKSVSDARFTAETMMLGQEGNIDPAITNFLKGCDLDVWGIGQFDTPPSLTLMLPKEICQLSGNWPLISLSQKKNPEKSMKTQADLKAVKVQDLHVDRSSESADHQRYATVDKTSQAMTQAKITQSSDPGSKVAAVDRASAQRVEVEYVFDSLAVHSKLQSLYQGFPLAFSTVEAGQIGGKQQVLEIENLGIADAILQPKGRSRKSLDATKAYFMAFYGSVSELISRLPK